MRASEFRFGGKRAAAGRLTGMCAVALKRPRQIDASHVPGGKRAPKPGFIEPCAAGIIVDLVDETRSDAEVAG
jgi:hypothetical protein